MSKSHVDMLGTNLKCTRDITLYKWNNYKMSISRIKRNIKSCPRIMRTYQVLEKAIQAPQLAIRDHLQYPILVVKT